jgi:hypothetical protein
MTNKELYELAMDMWEEMNKKMLKLLAILHNRIKEEDENVVASKKETKVKRDISHLN